MYNMKSISFVMFILCCLSAQMHAQLSGKSLQLKADYNYVTVPDASSLIPNSEMTIEAWLYYKCENGSTGNMIMSKGWCGAPDWTFYFNIVAQKMRFAKWRNGYNSCSGSQAIYETNDDVIPFNEWVHVAVSLTSTNVVTFYLNGVEQPSALISGTDGAGFNASTYPVLIGASRNISNVYPSLNGNLDEVRLWHTVRTSSELQGSMYAELNGNESGLYAYWKMNESGNGPSIVVPNAATATLGSFNGTTAGTIANLRFTDNDTIINGMPLCDPVLWLRADSAVTYNGSNQVSAWNDVSGNGNHVTQTNSINQPIYQTNVINNKPSVYFDGANGKYFMNNTTSNLVNSGLARTVFVSGRRDCKTHGSGVVGGSLFTFRRSGLINTLSLGANSPGTSVYVYSDNNGIGNNNASIAASVLDTIQQNFVVTYDVPAAGSQLKVRMNKIIQTVNQGSGSITSETGATGFTIGDREDQADLDWSGWINEVIVFNRSLTLNEIKTLENYLAKKYPQTPNSFNNTPLSVQTNNTHLMDDGNWKHSYNILEQNKIIASIKDYCSDLGTRTDTVYVESSAIPMGSTYAMRRHFVIHTSLNPVGTKRVRLYYTNADFTNLQTMVPSLLSHNQLSVTKYDGPNEDGVFDASTGTITFIPASQITTGSAFGLHYLEFDVTNFSEFWIHPFNIPLPLTVHQFEVYPCNGAACLNWNDSYNVSSYIIERSGDGKHFITLGTRAGEEKTYVDAQPLNGINFYRLRCHLEDGKEWLSAVKSLSVKQSLWEVSIYPTHSEEGIYQLNTNKNIDKVEVWNTLGQCCYRSFSRKDRLYLSGLPSGIYFIRCYASGEIQTLRISK